MDSKNSKYLAIMDNIAKGELDLAESLIQQESLSKEEQFEAFLALGNAELEQENWQKAITALLQAEKLDSNNSEVANSLGGAFYNLGDMEKSVEYCRKAASSDNPSVDAIINFIFLLESQEQEFEALYWYRKLLDMNITDTAILNKAADLALKKQRTKDAIRFLEASFKIDNSQSEISTVLQFAKKTKDDNDIYFDDERLRIVIFSPFGSFIDDIENRLKQRHITRRFNPKTDKMLDLLKWADVAWFDFAEDFLIRATRLPKLCRIVCRLHSYEIFTAVHEHIRWQWVDELIFVAEHVKEIFHSQRFVTVPMRVIPNGVDFNKFSLSKKKKYGKKVAYVGSINYKKGPSLLLQVFKAIHDYDSEYTFHIAGEMQDSRIEMYSNHMIKLMGIKVEYYGKVDDVAKWLADKDYIVSTSLFESFQYSLAEGIGRGLLPLVHSWQGSDAFYPEDSKFLTANEAVERIKYYESSNKQAIAKRNRKNLKASNSLQIQLKQIDDFFDELQPKTLRMISKNDPYRNYQHTSKMGKHAKLNHEYKKGLVSIIIPTFNREDYIAECVESALNQSYHSVEVIVVDDGSTDNTWKVLSKYFDKIVYIPQENQGVSGALNTAICASHGEYISWLSSDDAYPPEKVEEQVKFLKQNPKADWMYSDFYYMDGKSNVGKRAGVEAYTNFDFLQKMFKGNPINGCAVLFKRLVLKKTGLFDTNLGGKVGYSADGKMWHIMGYYHRFAFSPKSLVYYRWHQTNASHSVDVRQGKKEYDQHMIEWFEKNTKTNRIELLEGRAKPAHQKMVKDGMKILWIGNCDPCGNAAMNAIAINEYTRHSCRVLTYTDARGFDSDLVCKRIGWAGDDKQENYAHVKQLADWADMFVFTPTTMAGSNDPNKLVFDTDETKWGAVDFKNYTNKKNSVAFFFGSMSARRNARFYEQFFKEKGWPIFTGQLDLHRRWKNSVYVPTWIDLDNPRYQREITRDDKVIISQSPTDREVKNTAQLIEVVDNLKQKHPDLSLDLIEDVGFYESLKRKRKSHIGFDQMQIEDGYYCLSSLENSALGLVNITYLNDFSINKIKETTGAENIPWYNAKTEAELEQVIETLVLDRDKLFEEQLEHYKWIRKYWHPKDLVHQLTDKLEKLL